MTDKELIKQEIERRFNDNMKASEQYTENSKSRALFTSAAKEDYDLLAFIDSLPEEPASENKSEKELSETYLATFDKKYPILPTLKGKQKADFKNFLNKCQQEFGLKEFGIHPTQSKLFEKLTLLWATWGAEHLGGLGESNEYEFDKESISEDLEEAAKQHSKQTFNGILIEDNIDAFKAGVEWQKQQMMKNVVLETKVLMDCDGDGIETPYEEWLTLEDTEIPYVPDGFKDGDIVKVILIKEDLP